MRSTCVFTHRHTDVVADSIDQLVDAARHHGLELRAAPGEDEKHEALREAGDRTRELGWPDAALEADSVLVMAGDGTLLRVLNELRDGPPVFGINYGTLGYLTAAGPDEIGPFVEALAAGETTSVDLSVLQADLGDHTASAVNDVVVTGGATGRIIQAQWRVLQARRIGDPVVVDMGIVPCDGMVMSTPVGSTAFNLSNGGPVLAWGVDSFITSFVAPHILTARPLVLGRGHTVELAHLGHGGPLKVFCDGQQVGSIDGGEAVRVRLSAARPRLGLLPGATFFSRYRDQFLTGGNPFDADRVRADVDAAADPEVERT